MNDLIEPRQSRPKSPRNEDELTPHAGGAEMSDDRGSAGRWWCRSRPPQRSVARSKPRRDGRARGGHIEAHGASTVCTCPATAPTEGSPYGTPGACTYGDTTCTCQLVTNANSAWSCKRSACPGS